MKPKVEALMGQIESGNLANNNARILDYIMQKKSGSTIYQMRLQLGLKHQTLTSRVSELVDMGLIYADGTTYMQREGKEVSYTVYKFEPSKTKQQERAYNNRRKKYEALKRRLNEDFADMIEEDRAKNDAPQIELKW